MKRRIQRVLLAIQLTLLILSWVVFLGPGKSADAEMGISALLAMYLGFHFMGIGGMLLLPLCLLLVKQLQDAGVIRLWK